MVAIHLLRPFCEMNMFIIIIIVIINIIIIIIINNIIIIIIIIIVKFLSLSGFLQGIYHYWKWSKWKSTLVFQDSKCFRMPRAINPSQRLQ